MTGDHLLRQRITDISHIELFLLLRNLRVEADMEQHIAQLLTDIVNVVLDQGVAELVSLFYRIGSQTLVRLFLVPRTIGS